MKISCHLRRLTPALIGLLLSSCAATVPLMPRELDLKAETFRPQPGKTNIYVVRENQFKGSAIAFQVLLDGKVSGAIAPGTYFLFELPRGPHSVAVVSNENSSSVKINAAEGKNYFVEVTPRFGMMSARVSAEQIDEGRGRKLVIDGNRAEPF